MSYTHCGKCGIVLYHREQGVGYCRGCMPKHIKKLEAYIKDLEAELRLLRGGAAEQTRPKSDMSAAAADNTATPRN